MRYLPFSPKACDALRTKLAELGWPIVHQDVGQTELVGYGYVIVWQKEDAKITLHYNDRQGVAQAQVELNDPAWSVLQPVVEALNG
ncbi:hypothetical protein [Thiomicrorhabdus cannonii]|uniref:hypothetical protein n=1 Tax=Thiomicrorhabdus cannonii TaxID=2748011 RepID=UPI0015BF4B18|nr:hypothetical protein [Thiomicrorhabdus cannonii]